MGHAHAPNSQRPQRGCQTYPRIVSPVGDSEAVEGVVRWASSTRALPMGNELVPGASGDERSALAALGGLARELVPAVVRNQWPEAVQLWCNDAVLPPSEVANAAARAVRGTPDTLATIYERLVSAPNRRQLGTFFTPSPVVRFMLDRIEQKYGEPAQVIDPGAGVGAFTVEAAYRWAGTEVIAVDLNVVTLGLLGVACSIRGLDNVQLVHGDFLTWIRDQGQRNLVGRRLLIGNPPYTRHQEFDNKLKKQLQSQALELVDSGLAGLSAYFLAASLVALDKRDTLCFLLPSSWTETRYGRGLRRWLWEATGRAVEIHAFPASEEIFPGTQVTALVLLVGPMLQAGQPLTTHRARLSGARATTTEGRVRPRDDDPPTSLGPWLWHRPSKKTDSSDVPLSQLGRVRRGVATGANSFFFLGDADRAKLPDNAVLPALRRLRHVDGDLLGKRQHEDIGRAGLPRWLLWLSDPSAVNHPEVQRVLARGLSDGVTAGYLVSRRNPWYLVEYVEPPQIFVALMSKAKLRAVRNGARAVPSNSMYGIYLNNKSLSGALCSWLNSDDGQDAMYRRARHYSDGLLKLEPSDLLAIRVPSRERLMNSLAGTAGGG